MNDLSLHKWARDIGLREAAAWRHRIGVYDPGHVRYQFGHEPTRVPYHPTGEDWALLDTYAECGVGFVHLWYWGDWIGLHSKGAMEALNPRATRRFVDECHRRDLKVIPYVSPGYLDTANPTHRPEWSRGASHLVELCNDFDLLCPGSESWRRFFLDDLDRILDDYAFDGVYWDGGIGANRPGCANPQADRHVHFVEADPADQPASEATTDGYLSLWNDLLFEMYVRVKRRGGIVVAHIGGDRPSPFDDPCWDYLLVGEGIGDALESVDRTRDFPPYLIRFNDWSRLITDWSEGDYTPDMSRVAEIEHALMAACIPYLQFPWLEDGCYGEREDVFSMPGVNWKQGHDHWTEWKKAQSAAGLAPLGNASWAGDRDRYLRYLDTYRRMATDNALLYREIGPVPDCPFPTTEGRRRVSVFVNDALWVAVGNLEDAAESVVVRPLRSDAPLTQITLPAGRLTVLRYRDLTSPPEIITFEDP